MDEYEEQEEEGVDIVNGSRDGDDKAGSKGEVGGGIWACRRGGGGAGSAGAGGRRGGLMGGARAHSCEDERGAANKSCERLQVKSQDRRRADPRSTFNVRASKRLLGILSKRRLLLFAKMMSEQKRERQANRTGKRRRSLSFGSTSCRPEGWMHNGRSSDAAKVVRSAILTKCTEPADKRQLQRCASERGQALYAGVCVEVRERREKERAGGQACVPAIIFL